MSEACSNPNCYIQDGEPCCLGHLDHSDCEQYNMARGSNKSEEVASGEGSGIQARAPWSGNALGLSDLVQLTPRGRSILVGVLGAHDAGKTTLLLGNYMNLLKGATIAQGEFCGSRTLGAWESLASWVRFDDPMRMTQFPPHTPRGGGRAPGLLHFSLRRKDQSFRDVFLTDAPGEWFTGWAVNQNAPGAEGARWTVQYSDVFLVIADCERLSGPDRGSVRDSLRQLIERLGRHVSDRPVILVWSKTDQTPLEKVPERIRNSIQKSLQESIPHTIETRTSYKNLPSMTDALAEAINGVWTPAFASPLTEPVIHQQPFSAYRGHL